MNQIMEKVIETLITLFLGTLKYMDMYFELRTIRDHANDIYIATSTASCVKQMIRFLSNQSQPM